jgi:hypothetical protein
VWDSHAHAGPGHAQRRAQCGRGDFLTQRLGCGFQRARRCAHRALEWSGLADRPRAQPSWKRAARGHGPVGRRHLGRWEVAPGQRLRRDIAKSVNRTLERNLLEDGAELQAAARRPAGRRLRVDLPRYLGGGRAGQTTRNVGGSDRALERLGLVVRVQPPTGSTGSDR